MVSDWRHGFFCFVLAGAFLVAGLLPPAPAAAQTQQQRDRCVNKGNAYSADVRIDACTAAIKAAQPNGKNSAWAFNSRGDAYRAKADNDHAITDYSEAIRIDRSEERRVG